MHTWAVRNTKHSFIMLINEVRRKAALRLISLSYHGQSFCHSSFHFTVGTMIIDIG